MKIKLLPLALIFCASLSLKAQNVAINTDGSNADNSAMLDIKSTDKGMLIPRMTAAQRNLIASPATGLLVYQTDGTSGFYFNQGTPAAKNWILLGAKGDTGAIGPQGPQGIQGNTGPAGATGATGAGFSNGTAGGQIYVTSSSSPYSPNLAQTVTGDVTINASAVTTIANNSVTTSKINDGAVTVAKLPSGATSTTYLRGDGTWATPLTSNVNRNPTLSGDGTSGTPLGINLGNSNTWTANQTFGGSFLITANSRIAMTNSDNISREFRMQEPSGTGSQYIGLVTPSLTNNVVYELPGQIGAVGQILSVSAVGVSKDTGNNPMNSLQWVDPAINDNAVTSAKIANNAVTIAKLPTGATNTTFLRGDGTWATPSGGGGSLKTSTATGNTTLTNESQFVFINADCTITLPSTPTTGQVIYLYSNASTANRIINLGGKNLNSSGMNITGTVSFITLGSHAITLIYNGTQWFLLSFS